MQSVPLCRPLGRALGAAVAGVLPLIVVTPAADGADRDDDPLPFRVVTIAGTGEAGYSGDGGDALDARLNNFLKIDVDSQGNVYIADSFNKRLRVVTPDGTIDTVPGTRAQRSPETDGPNVGGWIWSPSNAPQSVAVADDDSLYIAGRENVGHRAADGQFTVITTSDGQGSFSAGGNGGDGGPASGAFIYRPTDVAVDDEGNVYIADEVNNRIRKVDTTGTITTVAGGGDLDHEDAEGGPATAALVNAPKDVAVDSRGNLYFTEDFSGASSVVRRVDPDGTITTLIGLQPAGFSGDGGPVEEAEFGEVIGGITVDDDDNLYVADVANRHVRVVAPDGTVTSVNALLTGDDLAVGPDGDLYVAGGNMVRKVELGGTSTADDRAEPAPSEDRGWTHEAPGTIVTVAGEPYDDPDPLADQPDEAISQPRTDATDPPGATVSGTGPRGVTVDADGRVYVADTANHRVVRVEADGTFTTVAGGGQRGPGTTGPASEAMLHTPEDLAVDPAGNLYIADPGDNLIRKVDTTGAITTVAGTGAVLDVIGAPPTGDGGPATEADLDRPSSVAVDAAGNLYVADTGHGAVRKVDTTGTITTIAGGGDLWAADADGAPATQASLWEPVDVAVDAGGNVYLIEGRKQSVRRVSPDGTLTTVAGDSYLDIDEGGFSGDGGPADDAELNTPSGVTVDAAGNLYIADAYNSRIRRVDTAGTITTIAGTGEPRDDGDDGPATEASLHEPREVAVGPDGTLYAVGSRSDRIRRVDADGTITTVARTETDSTTASESDGEPATEVQLQGPTDIAVDQAGDLYIAEDWLAAPDGPTSNGAIRRVDARGTISAVESHPTGEQLGVTGAVALDDEGHVYVTGGGAVRRRDLDGVVTTIAGGIADTVPDEEPTIEDGQLATTVPILPQSTAVAPGGELYVATRNAVYALTSEGTLTTVLGPDDVEGVGGIAADDAGNLYVVVDTGSNPSGHVLRVDRHGTVTTIAGTDEERPVSADDDVGDGGPATDAFLTSPVDVAVDSDGNVYVSERQGVRRIDPGGVIITVAESPREVQDDEYGSSTTYTSPSALAVDAQGNVYFVEADTHRVRVVVRAADVSGSRISPWGALLRGLIVVAVAALVVAGFRWRQQLAGLVARGPWSSSTIEPPASPDDEPGTTDPDDRSDQEPAADDEDEADDEPEDVAPVRGQ